MTKTELNELADEISRYKVKDRDYVLFELLSRTETVLRRAASHEVGVREALERISRELSALRKRDPAACNIEDELARIRFIATRALASQPKTE